jgi:endonuclease/exonuclease/phosphatase family metal-dependent hydrolase
LVDGFAFFFFFDAVPALRFGFFDFDSTDPGFFGPRPFAMGPTVVLRAATSYPVRRAGRAAGGGGRRGHYAVEIMTTGPETIRIATWNCFGTPVCADDFFSGRPFWPERFESAAVIETLSAFDVVCIQENFVERVRAALDHVRERAGFTELWFDRMGPDAEDGTFSGSGLAILSRWPLRTVFHRYARGAGPDGFARKGLAVAEVILPSGREVVVVNTHLQADDPHVPIEECREARAGQLTALADLIAPHRRAGRPVVVCGDLNVAHGSDEYASLLALLGGRSTAEEAMGALLDLTGAAGLRTYDVDRNDLAATFHSGGPDRALFDYIWVSPGFHAHEVRTILDQPLADLGAPPPPHGARAFPSDHFGVGATLHIVR